MTLAAEIGGIVGRLDGFVRRSRWNLPLTSRQISNDRTYRTGDGFRVKAIRLPEDDWNRYIDVLESSHYGKLPGSYSDERRKGSGVCFYGIPVERW